MEKVAITEKAYLNLEEAAAYFGIGVNKLREISNPSDCPFVLWNGNKRMIKRKILEQHLDHTYSI